MSVMHKGASYCKLGSSEVDFSWSLLIQTVITVTVFMLGKVLVKLEGKNLLWTPMLML
jgi:hypothetical protein